MALINIGSDPWLAEYDSCDKLQREIMEMLSLRDKELKSSDQFVRLSASIRLRLKQFTTELEQLKVKLDQESRSTQITGEEVERRGRQIEQLRSRAVLMARQFDGEGMRGGAERSRLLGVQDLGASDWGPGDASTQDLSVDDIRGQHSRIAQEQEKGLEELSKIISRQKNIAQTISTEVDLHNEILDELGEHVERTDTRVASETQHVQLVARKDRTCGSPERLTLADLEVTRKKKLSPRKENLYKRLQKTKRLLYLSRVHRKSLVKKCKQNKVDLLSSSTLDNIKNIYSLPRTLRIFVFSILRKFLKNKKAHRYTLKEKSLFLSILKHGPHCYRYLEKLLCLPSVRTLKRSLANFILNPGINDRMFEYLNGVAEKMNELDRHCVLMFDEMEVLKNLSLSISNDTWRVEGFVETGTERGPQLADHAVVFMIRGIGKKWKQPVAFYFTHNAANQYTLKALILQVVRAVHERTKFKIMASVCDGGSWNVAALRSLTEDSKRDCNDFVYNVDGHNIIHLFDAPHLLKCMRNNFMTKNILFNGKTARWSDIQKLYEFDGANGEFKATKLTNAHVNPTNQQKMRVKLAAQVFSHSTAAFLQILTNANVMNATGTAEFVHFMNSLFDSLNSVSVSTKPLACKVTKGSPHFSFWISARDALSNIQFFIGDKRVPNPPFIQLLLSTLRNAQYLWESLEKTGFKFITLRSFNQDPLENLFSVTRGLCGGNSQPSTTQFADAYKTAILNNTVRCSIGTNCEDDGENFLLSYKILLSRKIQNVSNSQSEPLPSTSFSTSFSNTPLAHTISQSICTDTVALQINMQTAAYVAGYLIKKLLNYECELCIQFFCADTITTIHDLTVLRDYGENKDHLLQFASAEFSLIIENCKEQIFSKIPDIITLPNILGKNLDVYSMPYTFCEMHGAIMQQKIIKLLTLVVLNHFVKLVNKKLRNVGTVRNNNIIENFYARHCK